MMIRIADNDGCFLMLSIAISMTLVAGLEGTGDVVIIIMRSDGSTFLYYSIKEIKINKVNNVCLNCFQRSFQSFFFLCKFEVKSDSMGVGKIVDISFFDPSADTIQKLDQIILLGIRAEHLGWYAMLNAEFFMLNMIATSVIVALLEK